MRHPEVIALARGDWHAKLDNVEAACGALVNMRPLKLALHDLPVLAGMLGDDVNPNIAAVAEWIYDQVPTGTAEVAAEEQERIRNLVLGAVPMWRAAAPRPDVPAPAQAEPAASPKRKLGLILAPEPTPAAHNASALATEVRWDLMDDFVRDLDDAVLEMGVSLQDTPPEMQRGAAKMLLHRVKGSGLHVGLVQLCDAIHRAEGMFVALVASGVGAAFAAVHESLAAVRGALQAGLMDEYGRACERLDRVVTERVGADPEPTPTPRAEAQMQSATVPERQLRGQGRVAVNLEQLDELAEALLRLAQFFTRAEALVGQRGTMAAMQDDLQKLRRIGNALDERTLEVPSHAGAEATRASALHDHLALDRVSPLAVLRSELVEATDGVDHHQEDFRRTLLALQREVQTAQGGWQSARRVVTELRTERWQNVARRPAAAAEAAARQDGKLVEVRITDGELRVDRRVLERLTSALEQLARNAVAHGIEGTRPAHKDPVGVIELRARQAGPGKIALEVADDGGGIDFHALAAKAEELRVPAPSANGWDVSHPEVQDRLLELIVEPGFSSRSAASQLAGRGEGLHIVDQAARQLGGRLDITAMPGRGTVFSLVVPVALDVTTVLPVVASGCPYGIPIETIEPGSPSEVFQPIAALPRWAGGAHELPRCLYRGRERPVLPLGDALGLPFDGTGSAALVGIADTDIVLGVSNVEGAAVEMVVRALDVLLHGGPFFASSVAQDGKPLLVLDVPVLLKAHAEMRLPYATAHDRPAESLRVLIADDAITVRSMLSQQVTAMGHVPVAVKDGNSAWTAYAADPGSFALVVTDLEMPHGNGLELIERIRSNSVRPDVPILVVTSRSARHHYEQVRARGGNMLLPKPVTADTFRLHAGRFLTSNT